MVSLFSIVESSILSRSNSLKCLILRDFQTPPEKYSDLFRSMWVRESNPATLIK